MNAPLRTDSSFRRKSDPDHHRGDSPIDQFGIGMVTQFVLDPMHLVSLGVVRLLIHLWLKGPIPRRVGSRAKSIISGHLVNFSPYIPREFARKGRSLNEVDRWKATEFNTFLLYTYLNFAMFDLFDRTACTIQSHLRLSGSNSHQNFCKL